MGLLLLILLVVYLLLHMVGDNLFLGLRGPGADTTIIVHTRVNDRRVSHLALRCIYGHSRLRLVRVILRNGLVVGVGHGIEWRIGDRAALVGERGRGGRGERGRHREGSIGRTDWGVYLCVEKGEVGGTGGGEGPRAGGRHLRDEDGGNLEEIRAGGVRCESREIPRVV